MENVILGIAICISLFAGCSSDEKQQAVYHKISAEEAYKIITEQPDYTLLDVRTDAEYKVQRIAGALLIPDYEIEDRAEKELPDKNRIILVYCRSGRRSETAARALVRMGYVNVYDFGGIMQWPYDTVSD
ncbi:MAG: rhodanese-like domain-containing protein [Treponema sp.]|jgi:rhodanese-related sulfurtransferase|nr:rhodanese-like domain-containing protein [Treponema sp.]